MRKIIIDCDCGEQVITDIDSNYDVIQNGENYFVSDIKCPTCKTKYHVTLGLAILDND